MTRDEVAHAIGHAVMYYISAYPGFLIEVPQSPVIAIFAMFTTLRYQRAGSLIVDLVKEPRQMLLFRVLGQGIEDHVQAELETWVQAEKFLYGLAGAGLGLPIRFPQPKAATPEEWATFWEEQKELVVAASVQGDPEAIRLLEQPPYIRLRGGYFRLAEVYDKLSARLTRPGKRPEHEIRLALDVLRAAPFPQAGQDPVELGLKLLDGLESLEI